MMLTSQLVALYLFYKTIRAFLYLSQNDESIADLRHLNGRRPKSEDKEKEKKEREWAVRKYFDIHKHKGALVFLSAGLPYIAIRFIIWIANN